MTKYLAKLLILKEVLMREAQKRQIEMPTSKMVLNMGPSHPAMHGTVRLVLELDGETVLKAEPHIGFLHRGFEKMCEKSTYTQIFPYTDRLNYSSPLLNNIGYALAIEKLLGIDVPERCKYLRVILGELARICDHLVCIGAMSMELGAFTVFLYLVKAREYLYEILEWITGARVTHSFIRIGGLKCDMPEGFKERVLEALPKVERVLKDVQALLFRNRIFLDRVQGTGVISAKEAIAYGFTGPCLRATGVKYDVRKAHPYLVYNRFEFDVPIGEDGDNYARYMVRVEEIYQSIKIIRQAIKDLPEGPINIDDPRIILPDKDLVYNTLEGTVHHFMLITEGIKIPKGEVYSFIEAANGELGFYIVSDGSGKPYKMRVRPPGFAIMQALPLLIEGDMLPDIIPTFGSINFVGGEIDR
jgi:NADH-quinone oxidoreductase subunit D